MHATRTLALLVAVMATGAAGPVQPQGRLVRFVNAPERADLARLPTFTSSDPGYDGFVNDYLMRHLTADKRGIYWGTGPMLGATDHLWVIEWDCWMLPWLDRAALGRERQGGSDVDVILTTLSRCTVDKFGYVFGAYLTHEPNNSLGGYKPTFGWPWPKYNRNYTTVAPTGWEFNDPNDDTHDGWSFEALEPKQGHPDHRLEASVTGVPAALLSPRFDCEAFQIPIVEVDVEYRSSTGADVRSLVEGLRLYWSTADMPGFSEARSVGVDFSALPPRQYADDYAEMAGSSFARYPLFFPMYLHPGWGRGDTRITGLKLMVGGREAVGAHVAVNYVRATYDVRMATTNAALINAAARFYLWNGDTAFLKRIMPRLRRAILFLQEHLGGRSHGLICQDWFVGHDGLGGDRPGHGMIGSYWDLLPSGRYDIESSIAYWLALRNMAALEDACRVKRTSVAAQSVLGPDGRTRIAYAESAATLRRHSERVKRAIEHTFWMPDTGRFCRNVDAYGRNHDYGFLHLNVQAVAWGIATDEQRRSVLSWLDGRPVPGDTSIGSDIYRWRFAPRSSTRRNTDYYFWPWIWDWRNEPGSAYRVYGDQMQDGGAIPATALWEAMARCSTGDQAQVDRAFERSRETQRWFEDVTAAGGDGAAFYRAYYHNRPDRGKQQSPMPGGIGLDREFLSDSSLGTLVPLYAFLGLDAHEDGVLTVAPCLPTGLTSLRVDNVLYRGRLLHIEASPSRVTIAGARSADGLKVRVQFRTAGRRATVTVNGSPVPSRLAGGRATVTTELNAESVTIRIAGGQPNNREPQMNR